MRSWPITLKQGQRVIHTLSTVPPTISEGVVEEVGPNYITMSTGYPLNARYRLYEKEIDGLVVVDEK